ncbi:hypothetical protein TIFTF001_013810 [Ficus carica]|uniref:Uncharacterized protein n=1 Tax=Ficus carica TaxID=3494 RepID=A0AA88A2L6_FICCA|nr:hypothetical protein TIFTF001_013810 [Ficus carica]
MRIFSMFLFEGRSAGQRGGGGRGGAAGDQWRLLNYYKGFVFYCFIICKIF